jgi:hypothetical protein
MSTNRNVYIGQHPVWDGKPTIGTVITLLADVSVTIKRLAKRKARRDAEHHLPRRLRRSHKRNTRRSKTSPALFSAYRAQRSNARSNKKPILSKTSQKPL